MTLKNYDTPKEFFGLINIRTDRKSQPGKFPWTEALRILSFFTSQSSPDKASLALGIIPLACLDESCYVRQLHTSMAKQKQNLQLYCPTLGGASDES